MPSAKHACHATATAHLGGKQAPYSSVLLQQLSRSTVPPFAKLDPATTPRTDAHQKTVGYQRFTAASWKMQPPLKAVASPQNATP